MTRLPISIKEQIRFRDIAWLMKEIDLLYVLERLKVRVTKLNGNVWRGYCPDHSLFVHRESSDPNWFINKDTGECFCHTEGRGSNLVYVAARLLGITATEAADWILGNEIVQKEFRLKQIRDKLFPQRQIEAKKATVRNLHFVEDEIKEGVIYDTGLAFFKKPVDKLATNILPEIVRHYKVIERKWGYYTNRVVVPVYLKGTLTGFVAIDILGEKEWVKQHPGIDEKMYKKVLYPSGFKSSENLFGYDDVKSNANRLIITEGVREVMKLRQEGYNDTVALFGVNLSNKQKMLLSELHPCNIFLMFDGDRAGHEASEKIAKKLVDFYNVYVCQVPENYDPKTLPKDQLKSVIRNSVLYKKGNRVECRV